MDVWMGCDQHVRYMNGCKGIWNTRNTMPMLELELEPVPVPCRVCIVLILLRCKVRWRIPFHLMTVGWYCYCLVFPGSLTVSHQQLEAITECHHRCEICLSTSPPQRIIISLELTLIPMPLSMSMTMLTEFCYAAFVFFCASMMFNIYPFQVVDYRFVPRVKCGNILTNAVTQGKMFTSLKV